MQFNIETTSRQPPAFNSLNLLSQLKKAKHESINPTNFVRNSFVIFFQSAYIIVILGFYLALQIVI